MRDGVEVKLHSEDGEMYVYARSRDRVPKERAMRLRQLRGLIRRLRELSTMTLPAREPLLKLGRIPILACSALEACKELGVLLIIYSSQSQGFHGIEIED